MADKRLAAEQDYNAGMKYKDIAEKYDVSINTVKSWKQRHGWSREKGAHNNKRVHTKRAGAPRGNRNAVGNKGGGAPKGNSNAVTHGFFRKHLPPDAFDIMQEIETLSPIDMLWDNIMIQYTAIIRAQQIMYVESKDELIKHLKKIKQGDTFEEKEWEFQYAWDRHASFLNAQSRAMSEFRSLVKQLLEMAHDDDERRLRLEQMQLGVEKSRVELSQLRGDTENDAHEQGKSYEEALNAQIEDVFDDEVDEHEET